YIGTLASGLAHEIRSPLNAIRLNLDLLKEEVGAVSEAKRNEFAGRLSLITSEVDGLQKLLTEFLTYAKPPKLEMLPTDLNHVLAQMQQFIGPDCDRRHIQVITDF